MRATHIPILILMVLLIVGCSKGGKLPVSGALPDESADTSCLDAIPVIAYDGTSMLGMLGAYNLSISPNEKNAELTPMRVSSLGESYIVSGAAFFTQAQCLKIKNIALDALGRIHMGFALKHPFERGDPGSPPSGKNRRDLDLFDVAMVIVPKDVSSQQFQRIGTDVYSGIILKADGYTKELREILNDTAALPYKICYESENNNRFDMGYDWQEFDVLFADMNPGEVLYYELYITMGYGNSADFYNRLDPTYYIPEFNRKAAWKIKVFTPTWVEGDTDTEQTLIIDVYDWNHGSTVAPDFPDSSHPEYIKAESNISPVIVVDIPDMMTSVKEVTTTDTDTNGWDDPISYTAKIANEKNLPQGSYIGLIKVADTRIPSDIPELTDSIIHASYDEDFEYYTMSEFATYQIFYANVAKAGHSYGWGADWGDDSFDYGMEVKVSDLDKSIYVTGYFQGTVDFDKGPGVETRTSNGTKDVYLLKLDKDGGFIWVATWGGGIWDEGHGLAVADDNSVYVSGYFQSEQVDFDPGPGTYVINTNGVADIFLSKFDTNGNFKWVNTWGSSTHDFGFGLATDTFGDIYITGNWQDQMDLDPSPGLQDVVTSQGLYDCFLCKCTPSGEYISGLVWGGIGIDMGRAIAIDNENTTVFVAGIFENSVDFDPLAGNDIHVVNGDKDIFLLSIDTDFTTYNGSVTWGSPAEDLAYDVVCFENSSSSEIYVTGMFNETVDFDPSAGIDNQTSNGGQDVYLSKFYHDLSYDWVRTWGGSGEEDAFGLDITEDGAVLVVGSFDEDVNGVDFDPGSSTDTHWSANGRDIFLSKFQSNGNFNWAFAWEGMGIWDEGFGVASGSYIITGVFQGEMDFNPGSGEDNRGSVNNSKDICLVKLLTEGADEFEPNNTCPDANEIVAIGPNLGSAFGAVRDDLDDDDYWHFSSGSNTNVVSIYLLNISNQNIDVYVYEENCTIELAKSINTGGSNEYIYNLTVNPSTLYKVLVQDTNDGFSGAKDYILHVINDFY